MGGTGAEAGNLGFGGSRRAVTFPRLGAALGALVFAAQALAAGAAAPDVTLYRIDCGAFVDQDLSPYSDTMTLEGRRGTLTVPCYLIRHGREWMLWDAGLPREMLGTKPDPAKGGAVLAQPIEASLARLGLKPGDVARVGISHYHMDHSGQLAAFPRATLLIGAADWEAVRGREPRAGLDRATFAAWTAGRGKVDPVTGDRDVFGDGSVVMLDLPGHTPGHHGLLVRLAIKGPVLLTGDLAHTADNYRDNVVPTFNTNRADSLASLDRFKKLARTLSAVVIVEHVAADIAKLPDFPEGAR